MKQFKPNPKYATKLRISVLIVAVLILLVSGLTAWALGHDRGIGTDLAWDIFVWLAALNAAWTIPALFLAGPYYRSLSYEILDDEVIVHVGIVTKSVKHVPYRTVTNITVKRGILDRWFFGLGTLNIQTAGMSGSSGAEESLVGLEEVHSVYDIVVAELRRFRGSMAPTAAEVEGEDSEPAPGTLIGILSEVKAIRRVLEEAS